MSVEVLCENETCIHCRYGYCTKTFITIDGQQNCEEFEDEEGHC